VATTNAVDPAEPETAPGATGPGTMAVSATSSPVAKPNDAYVAVCVKRREQLA